MKSARTKQCETLKVIFAILHALCLFGPLLFFIPYGFSIGVAAQKITLGLTIIVSLCLGVASIMASAEAKAGLSKTIMWVLMIGVLVCLTEVKTFIYIMAIVSIIDELVIVKLYKKYKDAYAANREIDRRP
jgi:hypothetical protein